MPNRIKITVTEAVAYLKMRGIDTTPQAVIRWCRKHTIGIQLGTPHGRWMVDQAKLEAFITEGTYKGEDAEDGSQNG